MRRQDRQITEQALIQDILKRGTVLHLGMCDGDLPYVLPLSYGYDGEALWVHCALAGRKVDILRRNPKVCFAIALDTELKRGEVSCGWSFRYRSVVGEGTAEFVEGADAKVRALDALMRQHGGAGGDYTPEAVAKTAIVRIVITRVSGKQSGY